MLPDIAHGHGCRTGRNAHPVHRSVRPHAHRLQPLSICPRQKWPRAACSAKHEIHVYRRDIHVHRQVILPRPMPSATSTRRRSARQRQHVTRPHPATAGESSNGADRVGHDSEHRMARKKHQPDWSPSNRQVVVAAHAINVRRAHASRCKRRGRYGLVYDSTGSRRHRSGGHIDAHHFASDRAAALHGRATRCANKKSRRSSGISNGSVYSNETCRCGRRRTAISFRRCASSAPFGRDDSATSTRCRCRPPPGAPYRTRWCGCAPR